MSDTVPVSYSRTASPWRAVTGWLSRVPIDDPVDKRNAPMLQIVLLLLAGLPPLAWAYRFLAVDIPWRPGEAISLGLSLAVSALAVFSFALIRRGRLRWAVRQLLVVVAVAMLLAYVGSGFDANRFEQPIQMIWLVIAGLMLGRRALWLMYGWIVLAFSVGIWRDIQAGIPAAAQPGAIIVDGVISAIIFLFIAIVIDRSVSALRESLDSATRRSEELALANERLQAEIAQRERVQAQLIHAQKVEAVGRLASGVAHDFNHLLGLILGYAAHGKRATTEDGVQKAFAGIDSAARRATAVTQKLLSFSRQDEARIETFDACAALREMTVLLRQLFDPDVAIAMDLPDRAVAIRFDRAQFELIILNLAANAQHAMPNGGRFAVALAEAHDGAAVEIGLHDTGHGMGEDVLARIFEPFFTTKPSGQGTGLGLAVAHDLVVGAGGDIRVESSPDAGATFRIRLPAATVGSGDTV